jgi:hypothetical protein
MGGGEALTGRFGHFIPETGGFGHPLSHPASCAVVLRDQAPGPSSQRTTSQM